MKNKQMAIRHTYDQSVKIANNEIENNLNQNENKSKLEKTLK